jgi:hypothetical protein
LALYYVLLSRPGAIGVMPIGLLRLAGTKIGIYGYALPKWKTYRSDPFDRKHFELSRKPKAGWLKTKG